MTRTSIAAYLFSFVSFAALAQSLPAYIRAPDAATAPTMTYPIPASYGGFAVDCANARYSCIDIQMCLKPSGTCTSEELVKQRLVFENNSSSPPPTYPATTTSVPAGSCAWQLSNTNPTGMNNCSYLSPVDPSGVCTTSNNGTLQTVTGCLSSGCGAKLGLDSCQLGVNTVDFNYTCVCGTGYTTTTAATTTTASTSTTVAGPTTTVLGSGGGGCFPAGTKVSMTDGSKMPIELVKQGDSVLSYDEISGEQIPGRVIQTLHYDVASQLLHEFVLANGKKLTSNAIHPIYIVEEQKYFKAKEIQVLLQLGHRVSVLDENNQVVGILAVNLRKESIQVFNLEVSGASGFTEETGPYGIGHNYYADGILVHNALHFLTPWLPRAANALMCSGLPCEVHKY